MVVPIIGTFVVLTINPSETLAGLEDEDLIEICMKMENKKYVAYVGEDLSFEVAFQVPYCSFMFYFLSQGLPPADNLVDGQEIEMSIPIMSNTSHPTLRPPLQVSQSLPWDDCYISLFSSIQACCRNVWAPGMPSHMVTAREYIRMKRLMSDDEERRKEVWEHKYPGQVVPPLHLPFPAIEAPEDEDSDEDSDVDSDGDSFYANSEYVDSVFDNDNSDSDSENSARDDSDRDASDSDRDDSDHDNSEDDQSDRDSESSESAKDVRSVHTIDDIRAKLRAPKLVPATMAVVNASFDLSTVDKFNDPKDFFKEVELLNKLREESQARKLQRNQDADHPEDGQACAPNARNATLRPSQPPTDEVIKGTPKVSSMSSLRKKTRGVLQAITPWRLRSTVLNIRSRGGERLDRAFCRLKGHHKAAVISDSDASV